MEHTVPFRQIAKSQTMQINHAQSKLVRFFSAVVVFLFSENAWKEKKIYTMRSRFFEDIDFHFKLSNVN